MLQNNKTKTKWIKKSPLFVPTNFGKKTKKRRRKKKKEKKKIPLDMNGRLCQPRVRPTVSTKGNNHTESYTTARDTELSPVVYLT